MIRTYEFVKVGWMLFLMGIAVGPVAMAQTDSAKSKDPAPAPVRIGVVGLVHDHVYGILWRHFDRDDIKIVGVAESNVELSDRYAKQFSVDRDLFHEDLESMLDAAKPEAVAIFTAVADHARVVELCAARGVHVLIEKALAPTLTDARAIRKAVHDSGIKLVCTYDTNFQTAPREVYSLVHEKGAIGSIRRIVYNVGHNGLVEIGVSDEFLDWLIDPKRGGGGAMFNFGSYGVNLSTWLMGNARPVSVTAITQQIRPERNPEVDDQATIVLNYPKAQAVIQASWNWPDSKKDLEVYGATGHAITIEDNKVRFETAEDREKQVYATPLPKNANNPFTYFAGVVRGTVDIHPLTTLENGMIVVEILDAARRSAASGETVKLR